MQTVCVLVRLARFGIGLYPIVDVGGLGCSRVSGEPDRPVMAPLPRGRGGLPSEASAFLQRARMLDATVRAVARDGYAGATVSAIQTRAGVSRRTFYDAFPNKEAAVVAALDMAARYALPQILGATAAQRGWAAGVDAGLSTYLRLLDRDRDWAALCLVGVPAAGEEALAHRDRLWAPVLDRLAPRAAARPAAAGALAALDSALRAGLSEPATPLTALRPEALNLLIGPVRGWAAARRQAARPVVTVGVRETEAEAVRALLAGSDTVAREQLRVTLGRALREGDGPALLQAVVGWQDRRASGGPVDEPLRRRALEGLDDAWSCGLPLTDVAAGPPGAWLPRSARDRILAWLAEYPDSTARAIGAGAGIGHHSTVHRTLVALERAGLAARRPGLSRAALWRRQDCSKKS
jgi:AcrR family transcriptional regulator